MIRLVRLLCLSAAAIALAGCVTNPPEAISKIPPENPSLNRVRMDIDSFIGTEVRWGGIISKVENKADETWIEIVRHQLRDSGRPIPSSQSDGRFIASFRRFADPVVYDIGRPLTVVGTIVDKVQREIGEYDYQFPIVAVEGSYLWQPERDYVEPYYPPPWWYRYPWYYDPWYYYPPHYHRPPRHR